MTDPSHDASSRWAAAAALADGVTDDGFHKRSARIVLRLVVLIMASWVTGVIVAVLVFPHGAGHSTSGDLGPDETGRLVAQIAFLILGLLVGIPGFNWAKRTGHYVTRWRAVGSPLNREEKKSVRRQISGKDQPDPKHLDVVLAIARQSRRATLGIAPLYGALVLIAVSTAIGSDLLYIKLLELAVSLMFVAAAVQLVVEYRRAGRFIDAHSKGASWAPPQGPPLPEHGA